jgi:hypothetical protein
MSQYSVQTTFQANIREGKLRKVRLDGDILRYSGSCVLTRTEAMRKGSNSNGAKVKVLKVAEEYLGEEICYITLNKCHKH